MNSRRLTNRKDQINESERSHHSVEMLHPRTEESKEEHVVCLTEMMILFKSRVLVLRVTYTCDSCFPLL